MDEVTALALDKFKRKLVRDLARRLHLKKGEESELWTKLNAEYGCDCHLLWTHMKSLTLKKLRRLLAAEDRVDSITKVARMTTTDWLTFDLVLVHEKVDVIGEDFILAAKQEPSVHMLLFDLIQKHEIDSRTPQLLSEKWLNLTKEYNTCGRQCSPMLLQRRWYQLKELTRSRLYEFWRSYRGVPKNFERAIERKPTDLQLRIAERYRDLITELYPEWKHLVEEKQIIMAEEFMKMSPMNHKNRNTKNDSDVIVLENSVDNVHLTTDSNDHNVTMNNPIYNVSKSFNENEMKATINNKIVNNVRNNTDTDVGEVQTVLVQTSPERKQNGEENYGVEECASDFILPKITCVMGNVVMPDSNTIKGSTNEDSKGTRGNKAVVSDDEDCVVLLDGTRELAFEPNAVTNDVIIDVESEDVGTLAVDNINDLSVHLELIDDGIELEDEIEYHESEKSLDSKNDQDLKTKEKDNSKEITDTDAESAFDEKLIMFPITYTRKLEDMIIFKNKSFVTVKGRDTLERAIIESKPVYKIMSRQKNLHDNEIVEKSETVPRVKYSSWRLRKLKNRRYNPIQLCKNPDFNTRLKRLTVGFFSSERNRLLFSTCKPLTIDVHKGFESKLVDNTLYLDGTDTVIKQEKVFDKCENTAPIMPSAVPVQSLLDNAKEKVQGLFQEEIVESKESLSPNGDVNERNKIIKLSDIEQIRLNNKKLLIAEVSPIRTKIESNENQAPVQLVDVNRVSPTQKDTSQSEFETSDNVPMSDKIKCFVSKKKIIIPKMKAPVTLPSWSVASYYTHPLGESLITGDTLTKIFNVLKVDNVDKTITKRTETVNKTPLEIRDELVVKEKIIKPLVKLSNGKKTKTNKGNDDSNKTKLNKLGDTNKSTVWTHNKFCCWAKYWLNSSGSKYLIHLCTPPVCKCCCRGQLVQELLREPNLPVSMWFLKIFAHNDIPKENNKIQETSLNNDPANDLTIDQPPARSTRLPSSDTFRDKSQNMQTVLGSRVEATDNRESNYSEKPTLLSCHLNNATTANDLLPSKEIVSDKILNNPQPPLLNHSPEPIKTINIQSVTSEESNAPSDASYHNIITDNCTYNQILPNGVKFILLPDNSLSMSIDPNVQINPAELAKLPEILIAVQKQLTEWGVVNLLTGNSISKEITNNNSHDKDDKSLLGDSRTSPTEANVNAMDIQKASNVGSSRSSGDIVPHHIIVDDNTDITKQTNCESLDQGCLDSRSPNVLNLNNKLAEKTVDSILPTVSHDVNSANTIDNKRNTILSDLMTISGISQDDFNSSFEEQSSSPAIITPLSDPSTSSIVSKNMLQKSVQSKKPLKKVIIEIRPRKKKSLLVTNNVIDLTEDNRDENGDIDCGQQMSATEMYEPNTHALESGQRPIKIYKLYKEHTYKGQLNSTVPYKIVRKLTKIRPNEAEKRKIKKIAKRLHSNKIDTSNAISYEHEMTKRQRKSASDSSDDEPLAEKRKRINKNSETSSNTIDVPIANSQAIVPIEKYSIPVEFENVTD